MCRYCEQKAAAVFKCPQLFSAMMIVSHQSSYSFGVAQQLADHLRAPQEQEPTASF